MADTDDESLNDQDAQSPDFDPWAGLDGVLEPVEAENVEAEKEALTDGSLDAMAVDADAGDGFGFEDLFGEDSSAENVDGEFFAEQPVPDGIDHASAFADEAALAAEVVAEVGGSSPETDTIAGTGPFADGDAEESTFFAEESRGTQSEASGPDPFSEAGPFSEADVFAEADAFSGTDAFGGFSPASADAEGESESAAAELAPVGNGAVGNGAVGIGAVASDGEGTGGAGDRSRVRPARPKKKGGGPGSIVGVVLGGVLSIPIVIGILWALGRLPDFSSVGRRSSAGAARTVAGSLPSVQNRSLDSLVAGGPAPVEAKAPEAGGTTEEEGPQPPAKAEPMAETVATGPPGPGDVAEEKVPAVPAAASADRPGDSQPSPAASAMKAAPMIPSASDDAEGPDARPGAPAVNGAESIGLDASVLAAVVPAMPKAGSTPSAEAAVDSGKTDPFGDVFGDGASDTAAGVRPAVAETEPLDTLAVDEAADAAIGAFDALVEVAADDPGRKGLLRDWYIALARVGEEAARLEGIAIERGSPLGRSLDTAERALTAMVADEAVRADMIRVATVWMRANARPSDGIVFPAVMPAEATPRSVGPWWMTKLRPSDAPDAPEVTIIARERPTAAAGEAVVVMGVILDGGVIWATQCRSLPPVPDPERAAAVEPAAAPATDPKDEPSDKQADKTSDEPSNKPTDEPMEKPADEPTAVPKVAPADDAAPDDPFAE